MNVTRPTHKWRRFWCKPEELYLLGDAGFLIDPDAEHAKYFQPHAVAIEALRDSPCLVLLGEPGMGKSTALAHERSSLAASGYLTVFVELLRESTAKRIMDFLDKAPDFAKWRASGGLLYLFLDALDEGLIQNPNLPKELGFLSAELDVTQLRLRITCRTLEWPSSLEQALTASWRDVAKYELLPLRRVDIAAAATDHGINPDAFVREVIARDAQPLATRPISLRFLLQTFLIDGRLPESKLRLYDEGCRLLCSDEGTWERGRPTPDAFRRMAIAARIAAAVTFTNRQLITRAGTTSNDGLAASTLIGGVEKVHGASYEVDETAIGDALQGSALFSARSTDMFGWAHQSHREFLAAWYLAHRDLDATTVASLYFQEQGPVPAPLREVAAWHATLVPIVFDMMLIRDPDVLMMSDTAAVSAPVRRALVNALLVRMDEFQAHDRNYNYDHYRRLDHSGLADQLRPYLVDRKKNVIVRRAAVDIAGACRVEGLALDLISLLRDGSEMQPVRQAAARALGSFDFDGARQTLRTALTGQLEPDPEDEILGTALRSLWPKHIDASTLFGALHMPKRTNFHGAYDGFLYELPKIIGRNELAPALSWVASTIDAAEYGSVSQLRDHILAIALTHLDDNEIARSVARLAIANMARYHNFFGHRARHRDSTEIRDALTFSRRRLLIEALLAEGAYNEDLSTHLIYHDPPLLLWSDLGWLLGHATSDGHGPHELSFAEFTKNLVMRFGYASDATESDQIAQAFDQAPAFRDALAPFFEVVDIESQRAAQLRAAWEAAKENRRRLEQQARDAEAEKAAELEARLTAVRKTLKSAEAKDVSWPQLYFIMTGGGFDLVADIDIWPLLDATEQAHLIEVARTFLEAPTDLNQDWLDTTSIPGLAFAAEAALCLLATNTSSTFEALSDSTWRRWGHVLVGLNHDRVVVRNRLVPAALRRCLPDFVSSLIRVIRRDDQLHGFVMSLDMLPLEMPVEVQRALIDTLPELADRSWRSVISALIASDNTDAMAIAIASLENEKATRAAVAAHAVLPHHPDRWSTVMTRMQRDRNFAIEFMNAFVDADHEPISDAVRALDEMQAAELLLTLLRVFPPEEDPQRSHIEMTVLTSRDQIARMRDRIARVLVDNGSVNALQWLVEQEPGREFLRWMLVDANSRRSDATWKPLELDEFLHRTGVLFTVVTETADRITIVFALPLAAPVQAAQSLQSAIPDVRIEVSESAIFVTRSDHAIRILVEMAERNTLGVSGNTLLGIRSGSEWLFEAVPPVRLKDIKQRDVNPDELRRLLEKVDVLLMTATPRETDAILSAMSPLSGESDLAIGTLSVDSYTVGRLGNYAVAHCQSGVGSTAADGSIATTCDAIREVGPKVIFLVGIAFGVRRRDQRIGDVLVAKHIRPYGMYKAKPDTLEERGYTIPASVQLMKWMQDRTREWKFPRADGSNVRILSPGEVLSGEVLVNNIGFRNWLTDRFPSAIGGEMEGIGAYAASSRYGHSHMLLVKAICDWADGCKNDRAQPFAAAAAVSAVEHLLSRPHIFASIGINMVT